MSLVGDLVVAATTPIFVQGRRKLADGTDRAHLSRFGDASWDVTPGISDLHTPTTTIHWGSLPQAFQDAVRCYAFALLNVVEDAPRLEYSGTWLISVKTGRHDIHFLGHFVRWLDGHGFTAMSQVRMHDLDQYLQETLDDEDPSLALKRRRLLSVQRLHSYRELLPLKHRLPDGSLWGWASAAQLTAAPRSGLNTTPRIAAEVMEPLLSAALLVSDIVAGDVLPVAGRMLTLRVLARDVTAHDRPRTNPPLADQQAQFTAVLSAMADRGLSVPAIRDECGQIVLDIPGMARAGWVSRMLLTRGRDWVDRALNIYNAEHRVGWLRVRRFSTISGRTWRSDEADADEIVRLVPHIRAACFITIAYLSGVRMGEALNLRRGCISRSSRLGLIFMSGEQLKTRSRSRERSPATIPWVVNAEVARAVEVLEKLAVGDLLFCRGTFCSPTWMDTSSSSRARTPSMINSEVRQFIEWFNDEVAPLVGHPAIPEDDAGSISAPRFRRTLSWHIVRKPGGLLAGAQQYGHLHTQTQQGYAGTADSGFPDEIAFETLLLKAETLHDDAERLRGGEHVSGPAANEYRIRVQQADRFAGLTLSSNAQARNLLTNPALNVHHGELLTCVYRRETAECRTGDEDNPNWGKCKTSCRNIARTDRDAEALDQEIARMEQDRQVMPSPLQQRIDRRLNKFRRARSDHEASRPATDAQQDGSQA